MYIGKWICNYFKITSVRAYYNVFLLPIRRGLERRPRLICALVFRARTEVYECYIYTRRDKTCYYDLILLSYHRMWGGVVIRKYRRGCGGLTVIWRRKKKTEIYHKFISRKQYFSSISQHAPPIKVITVTQL